MRKLLLVAAVMTAAFSIGVGARYRARQRYVPYTLIYRVTSYNAAGVGRFLYNETRAQSSSGRLDAVKEKADGSRDESFTEPGRGSFAVRRGKLMQFGDAPGIEPPHVTAESLRANTQYVRDDEVAGIPVMVMRVPPSSPGGAILEMWRAPSLDGAALRILITNSPDTAEQHVTVFEAVSLKRGEPDASSRVSYDQNAPVDASVLDKLRVKQ